MTDRDIYFNFSYLALKLLGKGLYSNTWTALSELIANSLDAEATKIYLHFDFSNPKNHTVELLDNGVGMDRQDLEKKYVWIGRNKRLDIDSDQSKKYMGRKGIGKLAALYLSNDYYLTAKTEKTTNNTTWRLNIRDTRDHEIPRLTAVDFKEGDFSFKDQWDQFTSGTYIKLNNVETKYLGEKSIDALRYRFGNFFLYENIRCKIYIGCKYENDTHSSFKLIEKRIAFKNLFSYFDNSGTLKDKVSETVKIPYRTTIPFLESSNLSVLDLSNEFDKIAYEGTLIYRVGNNEIKKHYQLVGWIGIHSTINSENAKLNDVNFLKNNIYNPNRLRLYTRNKLACDNFLDYIKNTQAFSNYIEGEITFDILDDDELEDIATANRQGFTEDDVRILELVKILRPIINRLISVRVSANDHMRKIEDDYKNGLISRAEAEVQKYKDEVEQKINENITFVQELERKDEQIQYISDVSKLGNKDLVNVFHSVYNNSDTIISRLSKIKKGYFNLDKNIIKNIEAINITNYSNFYLSYSVIKSKLTLSNTRKNIILPKYVFEYIEKVWKKTFENDVSLSINIHTNKKFEIKISDLKISSIIDNLINNALKFKAKNIYIDFDIINNSKILSFYDDGLGFDSTIRNLDDIFTFGFSSTNGTGIGLFYVKEYVSKSQGTITPIRLVHGAKFELVWKENDDEFRM